MRGAVHLGPNGVNVTELGALPGDGAANDLCVYAGSWWRHNGSAWVQISAASSGASLPPGIDGEDGEDGRPIPGNVGATGSTGAPGAAGIALRGDDGEDGEEGRPIPGNTGATGATGAPGFSLRGDDGEDGADGRVIQAASSAAAAAGVLWGKITNATEIAITSAVSATLNRLHVVSGTSADYTITISGLSPSTGDVLGFYVKDNAAASKQFKLDAGGTVKIAGRTRYLVLLHANVVLLRWDGTDWHPLVLCLDTPWVDAGAITITAVTTNPTKGTTSRDKSLWRRIGKGCQIRMQYVQTAAGTTGSGDYLFTIPIGTIDSAFQEQNSAAWLASDAARYHAPHGYLTVTDNTSLYEAMIVPYNTTQFRVGTWDLGGAGGNAQGSVGPTFALSSTQVRFSYDTTLPMTDW